MASNWSCGTPRTKVSRSVRSTSASVIVGTVDSSSIASLAAGRDTRPAGARSAAGARQTWQCSECNVFQSGSTGGLMHDLVIRGGKVVDGTGAPAVDADVAIDDGRVTLVGRVDAEGEREIDATGRLVTPGFVDIHTHYDGQV